MFKRLISLLKNFNNDINYNTETYAIKITLDNVHEINALKKIVEKIYFINKDDNKYIIFVNQSNKKIVDEFLFHMDLKYEKYFTLFMDKNNFEKLNKQFYTKNFNKIIDNIFYIEDSQLSKNELDSRIIDYFFNNPDIKVHNVNIKKIYIIIIEFNYINEIIEYLNIHNIKYYI
jgi:hypothetical protein